MNIFVRIKAPLRAFTALLALLVTTLCVADTSSEIDLTRLSYQFTYTTGSEKIGVATYDLVRQQSLWGGEMGFGPAFGTDLASGTGLAGFALAYRYTVFVSPVEFNIGVLAMGFVRPTGPPDGRLALTAGFRVRF